MRRGPADRLPAPTSPTIVAPPPPTHRAALPAHLPVGGAPLVVVIVAIVRHVGVIVLQRPQLGPQQGLRVSSHDTTPCP